MSELVERVARAICGADHPNFKDGGHPGVDDWDREEAAVAIRAVAEWLSPHVKAGSWNHEMTASEVIASKLLSQLDPTTPEDK